MMHALGALVLAALFAEPTQQLRTVLAARPYVEADAGAVDAPAAVPANVAIAESYGAAVRLMLERSATFRQQCRRLGRATGLVVTVQRWLVDGRPRGAAANTTVVRRTGVGLAANVLVGEGSDPVELIAHEFEHILEQLDGVDLAAMARRSGTGVRLDPSAWRFETDRAIAAGRRVAREVSHARR